MTLIYPAELEPQHFSFLLHTVEPNVPVDVSVRVQFCW